MARTTSKTRSTSTQLGALDTITASLVARQSRTDDGTMSVPDQIDAMRDWCAKQNPPIAIGPIYTELSTSGRKPLDKRKGLRSAVEDVERGASQMILTAYFDRFVRSVRTRADVLSRVEDKGGVVMTIDFGQTSDATPASKFTGTILAAVAEFQAEQTGEKLNVTKQRNIDAGIPPFPRITPAYVKREDGTLEQSEHGPLVREACLMRIAGKSYTTILRHVRDNGLDITHTGLTSMLSSKLLCGEIHFGEFTPNLNAIDDPILSKSEWRKMNATTATRGRKGKSDALLARQSILVCGTCGARLTVVSSKPTAGGKLYPYYRCGNRVVCTAPASVAVDVADKYVSGKAIELSASFAGHARLDRDIARAEAKLDKTQKALDKAMRVLLTLDDEDEAKAILDEKTAERDAAKTALHRLEILVGPATTVRTIDDWATMSLDGKRAVISATIARAVVAHGRGEGRIVVEPRAHLVR